MAQAPAVVIVARHGPRLDAADQQWHLSTPTPYDPPLTYGGWNQCRALGLRVANLLHAREERLNTPGEGDGVTSHDFATVNANGKRGAEDEGAGRATRKKRRVVKHKVVIHTSPFLRCLQTSTAIAAGLAQFSPTIDTGPGQQSTVEARSRSPSHPSNASPRLRAAQGEGASPLLAPIPEPKHDLAHEVARRALQERKRYRKSKLRVDAFLGEWLNPQYFEDITPPPPSALMVKTAKAELMQNDTVEVFTPLATSSGKPSGSNSLWSGSSKRQSLDEWSQIQEALPLPTATRESRSRASTIGSDTTSPVESGRKSPFRPGSALSPLTSTLPKAELTIYHPPTPQYAVSSSDQIPRGYFAHARNACANVDFQWDSSRPPQNWGNGGELGEEWSAMHKRFRKGLGSLVEWYSRHDADDRGEDALGIEQAERREDGAVVGEQEEELVVIMVTHGAGCNALIGALTGQPVLLDVGMASLTMATRKDDAPRFPANVAKDTSPTQPPGPDQQRRGTTDLTLPNLYDMKIVASTEHLRPGSNISSSSRRATDLASVRDSLARYKRNFSSASGSSIDSQALSFYETPRSTGTQSALLGSIRRPSATPLSAPGSTLPSRMNSSLPTSIGREAAPSPPLSQGLWTPPAGRTPVLRPQLQTREAIKTEGLAQNRPDSSRALKHEEDADDPDNMALLDFSTSPPDSRPGTSAGNCADASQHASSAVGGVNAKQQTSSSAGHSIHAVPLNGRKAIELFDKEGNPLGIHDNRSPTDHGPSQGQNGSLDGTGEADKTKTSPTQPKRRWTTDQRN